MMTKKKKAMMMMKVETKNEVAIISRQRRSPRAYAVGRGAQSQICSCVLPNNTQFPFVNVCEKSAKRLSIQALRCASLCPPHPESSGGSERAAPDSTARQQQLQTPTDYSAMHCKPLPIIPRCAAKLYAAVYGNIHAFPAA
jgi:hypothetical protein